MMPSTLVSWPLATAAAKASEWAISSATYLQQNYKTSWKSERENETRLEKLWENLRFKKNIKKIQEHKKRCEIWKTIWKTDSIYIGGPEWTYYHS